MSEAFIYDAIRTPRGRGNQKGSLAGVKPISLVTGLLAELVPEGGEPEAPGFEASGPERTGNSAAGRADT